MKLINEKLAKFKFILFFIVILLEVLAFLIVIFMYRPIYIKTIEITKNHTINKTISATKIFNDILKIALYRYLCDLKLIGKHMSFLGDVEDDTKYIKRTSQYYKNLITNEDKVIVYGTMEELKKINNLTKYYKEEENRFQYFSVYNKDYLESGKQTQVINVLKNKTIHPELNMIAYYKLNGNLASISQNRKIASKYMISILKTNLLRRFVTKGNDIEFMHMILLIEDEIYIYPPEAFNNTELFYISNKYRFNCSVGNALNNFPTCVYKYMNQKNSNFTSYLPGYTRPSMFETRINYEQVSVDFCINIPFDKAFDLVNLTYNPYICLEFNFTKLFDRDIFESKEAFEFIFFFIDPNYNNDIIGLYTDKKDRYEQIKTVFNDNKFKDFNINPNSQNRNNFFYSFSLFHFLYVDIFNDSNSYSNLEISIDEIIEEYYEIKDKIVNELSSLNHNGNSGGTGAGTEFAIEDDYKVIEIEKTCCRSDIYYNNMTCLKDTFLFIIFPLYGNFSLINEYFMEDYRFPVDLPLFYSLAIINTNDNYMKWKINNIMIIKIIKLFMFYFIVSICIIFIYFILVQIFYETRYKVIEQISEIIQDGQFFELKDKNDIIKKKESIVIEPNNKEMTEVKNLFDNMVKTMLLKYNFDEKNINFTNSSMNIKNKYEKSVKNSGHNHEHGHNENNLDSLNEYMDLIKNISNPEIRIMCIFIISYGHFKKGLYKLSENEFKNLLIDMNNYESKMVNKNDDSDSKLKDTISRCSKISYLNEYSLTTGMNETMMPIIKAKLLKQKIYYLYALCIYNQEKMKSNQSNNKDNNQNNNNNNNNKKVNNENSKKRYEEAIKYFSECKNISSLLGTDTIREIFSLIMISKCYIELKNYKESMININEALILYTDLQKSFKDKTYFNPKVMLFTENYIFQSIMLSMAQTTYSFNKYHQSCWILMKIIETSPFVFNNIHYQACFILSNCLKQLENNYNIAPRQIDKYRKNINKMFARINIRLINKEKVVNKDLRYNTNNNTTNNYTSNPSAPNTQVNTMSMSDNYFANNLKKINNKKDLYTNKINSASSNSASLFLRNKYKNITLCVSEKVITNINGEELKDVLIKFSQKCFSNCADEDKFAYIQFSGNGKKTISIKPDTLEVFLQKMELNKGAFQINENYQKTNNETQFMEFSNLFLSIIKSQKQTVFEDKNDHIIIIFINTEDIRFNSKKECVDTINELNTNNYTLIIFTYDTIISSEKIANIHSFLCGLNDGHFFQIKNYQQIKQVLMNFATKESQEKFVNYDYEITDYML